MSQGDGRVRLLDLNLLLASVQRSHLHHEAAAGWLRTRRTGARWATTPFTETGLVRLLLNERVSGAGVSRAHALATLGHLRAAEHHVFLPDASSLAETTLDLTALWGHTQVTDFHLLDVAQHHDAVLATFDRAIATYVGAERRELVEIVPLD